MRRLPLLLTLLCVSGVPDSRADEVVIDGRTFRVPAGFVVEKVAGPPLVDRPVVADFDEQGRLYVADSSGTNDPVKKQLVDRPHRILRLEDTDGDGKFDRSVVFADQMMFPEGAMWLDGSLYVAAPPSIWKLTDTDNDGIADRREEWFQGKTLTGCANDLHGPYAGPDGRIYWCKGAFASQTYDRPGRKPLNTRAAHLFRARPDGTEIEPVMTGGMDNPVEIAFTPEGERIFTTTFLQHPGGGNRDGLIHALYGGLYGKDHDVLDGHPRTGPDLLPALVHLGPAAPSGLMRAESDALGSRDCLFSACFNLRKIARHRLRPEGGSFAVATDDFLVADDFDFHPTDVLEDADGSLLVINTGGWFKLCCPTSQLAKSDILGAIYRVSRVGAPKLDDPRGLKIAWPNLPADNLAALLDDPRPAVRKRAVETLAKIVPGGLGSIAAILKSSPSVLARRQAVWTTCRIDDSMARKLVRVGLNDSDPSVRQAAIHASSVWRDGLANDRLIEILRSDSPAGQRAAAEALGRIGKSSSVSALLDLAGETTDWALSHSLTYALIEIADGPTTRLGLTHPRPLARRASLIALDQMEGGPYSEALPTLNAQADPGLLEAACWVASRHSEQSGWLASLLRERLLARSLPSVEAANLEALLARSAGSEPIQTLLANALDPTVFSSEARLVALRAMARSGLKPLPPRWAGSLAALIEHDEKSVIRQAFTTIRLLNPGAEERRELSQAIHDFAARTDHPADLRIAALGALSGPLDLPRPEIFSLLHDGLQADRPTAERAGAADLLARSRLDNAQLARLTEAVAIAGPLELGRLLDAFEKASDDEIGRKLVLALSRSPVRSTLRVESLRPRLERFGAALRPAVESLYKEIEADSADRHGQLETMLANLKGGDIRRGQAVFNGTKASCVTCHAIGYVGGKLGPDLTRIGQVRGEHDLLESIAFPSASFVRSYEPVSIATKDGKVVSGLLKKESGDEIIVAVAADREERIARDQVEEIKPGTVSVMPAGLDRQLTPRELADLIAFLKACR